LPQGERYFGIAAGPMTSKKSWPRQGYIALAAQIRALGLRPVFLLGTDEVEQRGWFERNVPGAIVIDLQAARGDAMYLFWLLHACAGRLAGCVANESGLGHLVATRGIPLLTLAGPTNAPRWKPLTSAWWLLRAQDFGSNDVAAIPVEAVEEAIGAMVRWNESNRQNALRIDAAQGSS
jgi:ADP-heptose:LPS heptosyltransferase